MRLVCLTSASDPPQFHRSYRIPIGYSTFFNHSFQFLWANFPDLQNTFMTDIGLIIIKLNEEHLNPTRGKSAVRPQEAKGLRPLCNGCM